VSSDEQREHGTIENQLTYLRDRCRIEKWEIAGEYVDDGVTGTKPLNERPAARRMLGDAKAEKIDTLLVYRVDRLARLARSLRVLVDTHATLTAFGIHIRSATEPLDTSSPFGVLIFQLSGGMSEMERSTMLRRTELGCQRVARAGRFTGGQAPFGYHVVDGRLEPHPERASILQDAFKNVAAGSTFMTERKRPLGGHSSDSPPVAGPQGGTGGGG
jgi:site-specific DNA recombinase